jgi:uncharacterized membrane protein YkvA (DUF1232 family)
MTIMDSDFRPTDSEFSRQYSEKKFWEKLVVYAKSAGTEVVERALQLYYAAQEPATPAWAKGVIIASLGYFISPLDAILDVTPVVGFSDDFGVLALAIATVAVYITPAVKQQARAKMKDWFGKDGTAKTGS